MYKLKPLLQEVLLIERRVKVPDIIKQMMQHPGTSNDEIYDFYSTLGWNDTVDTDLIDTLTGEVLLEKGQSKRDKVKKMGKRKYKEFAKSLMDNYEKFVFIPKSDQSASEFEKVFVVLKKSWSSILDRESQDTLWNGGYDINIKIPMKISRKDNQKLTEWDIDNIRSYLNWYEQNVLSNSEKPIGLDLFFTRGGKVAEIQAVAK